AEALREAPPVVPEVADAMNCGVLSIRQLKGGNAMKKQLFAVMALALVASSAFAQVTLPGNKRGHLPDVPDIIKTERTIDVLQVTPLPPPVKLGEGIPSGITPTSFCLHGPLAG